MMARVGLVAVVSALFVAGCTCDPFPIDSHKYKCTVNTDCGPDLTCISGVCGGPEDGGAACNCAPNPCGTASCQPDGGCAYAARTGACDAGAGASGSHECLGLVCRCSLDGPEKLCGNGIDDDCDGLIDCADPDCAAASCRPANGLCDVAEVCTGTACPANGFADAGQICRASTGACDLAETCSGSAANCPADALAPATTVCRPSTGACDLAESCTGAAVTCPADVQTCGANMFCNGATCAPTLALGAACTGAVQCASGFCADGFCCNSACAGTCDVCAVTAGATADGTCTNLPSSTICRGADGGCDVAESCTGSSGACPADAIAALGTVCRPDAGPCDVPEVCDGTSTVRK